MTAQSCKTLTGSWLFGMRSRPPNKGQNKEKAKKGEILSTVGQANQSKVVDTRGPRGPKKWDNGFRLRLNPQQCSAASRTMGPLIAASCGVEIWPQFTLWVTLDRSHPIYAFMAKLIPSLSNVIIVIAQLRSFYHLNTSSKVLGGQSLRGLYPRNRHNFTELLKICLNGGKG